MAREQIDIMLDDTEDLFVDSVSGDFAMVESTGQHQRQLILNNKGDFKEFPDMCVGVENYMDDEGKSALIRAIAIEFMQDGMDVKDLSPNADSVADSTVRIFENAVYR
jgi:hypothetical protein